jgi:hypothetical protein
MQIQRVLASAARNPKIPTIAYDYLYALIEQRESGLSPT